MKAIYTTLFFLLFASNYFPQDLPHWETEEEKIYREKYGYPVYDFFSDPPPSPVRGMAEWEELQGIIITWTSFTSILRQIVDYAQEEGQVFIICSDSNSVKSYLQAGGVPLLNLKFLVTSFNSIWVRDYGPWTAAHARGRRLLPRPRPRDPGLPQHQAWRPAVRSPRGRPLRRAHPRCGRPPHSLLPRLQ